MSGSSSQLVDSRSFTGSSADGAGYSFVLSGDAPGTQYQVQLQERNSCGWGPVTSYNFDVIDCAGGVQPFRVKAASSQPGKQAVTQPSLQPDEPAVYPNPAGALLTLRHGAGTIVIRNSVGLPVISRPAAVGTSRLDTSALPNGLYFLEMRGPDGKAVQQQLLIQH